MQYFLHRIFNCSSSDIQLGLRWYELGSKVGAFWMKLPTLGSASPSLDIFPLLRSELGCNSILAIAPYPAL